MECNYSCFNCNRGWAVLQLKLGHGWVISSHSLMWMWLLIHALNQCSFTNTLFVIHLEYVHQPFKSGLIWTVRGPSHPSWRLQTKNKGGIFSSKLFWLLWQIRFFRLPDMPLKPITASSLNNKMWCYRCFVIFRCLTQSIKKCKPDRSHLLTDIYWEGIS